MCKFAVVGEQHAAPLQITQFPAYRPAACPQIAKWGLLRWIRDVFQVSGLVVFHSSTIVQIVLNRGDPVAREIDPDLAALLTPEEATVILGEI
ncbi:MAG: hypothetical protein ABIN58_03835 [candidate division WOR-3 bacterium]